MIRVLGPDDAAAFRDIRLRAVREHPEAFGRTPEEVDSVEVWAKRMRADATSNLDVLFGAFVGGVLVGVAGCHRDPGAKQRHIGYIWGMYVTPDHRRTGLGRALFIETVEHAKAWPGVDRLWLDVVTTNHGARALYLSCGFRSVAVKPCALKVGDDYYDEELMVLDVPRR